MMVHRWYQSYDAAERSADLYKGDTQTDLPVRVVEDMAPSPVDRYETQYSRFPFAVVIGEFDDPEDRYEVQYTA